MELKLTRCVSVESGGIQNSSFETAQRRRSNAYAEAYAEMLQERRTLSLVQAKLTKNGGVSSNLQRSEDCWLK